MIGRHEEGCYKKYIFRCLQRAIERSRLGGKGYRISGHTAGSRFQNRQFRERKVVEAAVERLSLEQFLADPQLRVPTLDYSVISFFSLRLPSYSSVRHDLQR